MFLCDSEADVQTILAAGSPMKRLPKKPQQATPSSGIAVIQIRGTLTKYGSEYGPSTIELAWLIQAAANDPSVEKIVLWCDSGGGEVAGTIEAADAVAAAARRKPVIGLAEDMTASGAYLILSQCTKVYATNRLTLVGSIGVLQVAMDTSELAKRAGVKMIRVRSGDLKGIGIPGIEITEQEMAYLRKLVMFLANEFVLAVSRGRKIPPDQVRDMATGAVWPAAEAKRLGLIDGIKTLDEILTEANSPLMKLAADAAQFAAIVANGIEAGDYEENVKEDAEKSHPTLAKQAAKFAKLPTWQQEELNTLVLKGKA